MAQPTPYTPIADFTQDEANSLSGRSTVSTAKLDGEFAAVELTLDAVCANLEMIQRDDGLLRDGAVRAHAFAPDALLLMAGSWVPRGAWVTATKYEVGDVIANGPATYVAAAQHIAGVFATDLAAGRWLKIYETGGVLASGVIFTPVGGVAATNLQAAVAELDSEKLSAVAAASTYMTQAAGNQIQVAVVAQSYTAFTTSGTAPNYTLTPTADISAYTPGLRFNVTFHAGSSAGSTLSVSGLSAKGLKQYDEGGAKVAAAIYAGMVSDIVYDGTDFVVLDAINPQGLYAKGVITLTDTADLVAADVGKSVLLYATAPKVVALPPLSSVAAGARVEFFNANVAGWTVSTVGADLIWINAGTGTGMSIGSGDSLTLESRGDVWFAVGGTAQLWYASGLATAFQGPNQNLDTNGYQKLPGGLILQWGTTGTVPLDGTLAFTFPIAFPSAVFFIGGGGTINGVSGVGAVQTAVNFTNVTTTGARACNDTVAQPVRWLALGK